MPAGESTSPSRRLYLVRHATSRQDPTRPPSHWGLTGQGRREARRLAGLLAGETVVRIVCSREPKAVQTAEELAEASGDSVALEQADGLEEQHGDSVGWLTPTAFRDGVRSLFEKPDERCFGDESAREATERFSTAVHSRWESLDCASLVVVSHGRVISLFVAAEAGVADVFDFWRRLPMPALVTLEMRDAEGGGPRWRLLSVEGLSQPHP